MALMADVGLESLMRLKALAEGTKVAVACYEWTRSENLRRSIENAGLKHIELVMGCCAEPESLKRMLKEAQVVVLTSLVARRIRHLTPRETEVIVDDRTLNKGDLEMLRQRLAQMLSEIENRGTRHARH